LHAVIAMIEEVRALEGLPRESSDGK
jgi:hypothetical protein